MLVRDLLGELLKKGTKYTSQRYFLLALKIMIDQNKDKYDFLEKIIVEGGKIKFKIREFDDKQTKKFLHLIKKTYGSEFYDRLKYADQY
ncbi:hypothetical protein GOV04_03385 [Candidatus Woesearchaeota archaeon]|nr:hypothetical protein [Candidatus Woesearchaeota archaeon]